MEPKEIEDNECCDGPTLLSLGLTLLLWAPIMNQELDHATILGAIFIFAAVVATFILFLLVMKLIKSLSEDKEDV